MTKMTSQLEQDFRDDPFAVLRRRWERVPAGDKRHSTSQLAELSDGDLLETWGALKAEAVDLPEAFSVRGWYHQLYKDIFSGKKVMDVGCGLGLDGLSYAASGAEVTFVDILPSNVALISRVARLKGLENTRFLYLESLDSLNELADDYDVIYSQGSLINAPFDVTRTEVAALLRHLPVGGRWVSLAYPPARWEREGRLPFSQWGEKTDGPGTPWVEWYDLEKMMALLAPARFDTVLYREFHNSDFNWFDLVRRA